VAPPLVAEKVLLSLYVVGFAAGFRYFLLAFGPRCAAMSWAALLMVYSRCFWLGFYNYCVGIALVWITLGFVLRRRGEFSWRMVAALSLLFTLAYFTHLSVFLLAMLGAGCIGLLTPSRRLPGVGVVVTAAIPALCLTAYYFGATGFANAPSALQIVEEPLARLRGEDARTTVVNDVLNIDGELFAHHVGEEAPGTLVFVGLLALQTAFNFVESRFLKPVEPEAIGRTFPLVFAVLIAVLYFLLPNDLGEHGGFIKTRLAPLFFLFWLATLRESTHMEVRWFFRGLTFLLAVLNLGLVIVTFEAGNRALEEYNAGIAAVGTGKRLFVVQTDPRIVPLVNPLLHAADYYCLGTHNVNLDNYEAASMHFPVKYRTGMTRGRNYFNAYPDRDLVDVILCCQLRGAAPPRGAEHWIEIFRGESLRIYARP
jgi:hypothetical protein